MLKQILQRLIIGLIFSFVGVKVLVAVPSLQIIKLENRHSIHYQQLGNKGRALILLTGYATTSNFWPKSFINCLAQHYQLYLLDYQGILTPNEAPIQQLSINSLALDVNQFTLQLNLKNPILLGWSMGGAVALEASFIAPNLYSSLVLLAPVVPNQVSTLRSMPAHTPFHNETDVLNYVFNNNLYGYSSSKLPKLRKQFLSPKLSELFPKGQIISLQESSIRQWRANPKSLKFFQTNQLTASFYIPEYDMIINQSLAASIINQYPNAEIIQVKNSGHALAWQIPQLLCQDISAKN